MKAAKKYKRKCISSEALKFKTQFGPLLRIFSEGAIHYLRYSVLNKSSSLNAFFPPSYVEQDVRKKRRIERRLSEGKFLFGKNYTIYMNEVKEYESREHRLMPLRVALPGNYHG